MGRHVPEASLVRVAVIDSGANVPHPHVQRLAGGVAFDEEGREHDDYVDRLGHGTAVTAAIHQWAPTAALFAVKVFDRTLTSSVASLIAGIDWAASKGVTLVNLSLGTANPDHASALGAAVARARTRGAVVIAAGENNGVRWLPGTLEHVIRVELDWDCPRGTFTFATDRDGAPVFRASGYPRPIPGVKPPNNLKGLSFSVANMTGLAAKVLEQTGVLDYDELVTQLKKATLHAQ